MKKDSIVVILGPTASGKSDLAVEIAKKFNGEVISADSRQVYKGMDLGTGKITKKEMRGVPHHLLNVCNPKKVFTVSEYKMLAEKVIQDILKRNKLPIICGGTGFYIDAVVPGAVFPEVKANPELRKELGVKSHEELIKMLKKLDPERFKTIDIKNKVRLVRAIEIATVLGNVPKIKSKKKYNALYIGIKWTKEKLRERIYSRIISRIKKGMIKEIENLHKGGVSWRRMFSLGLEYRYISLFLQKKITKEEMVEILNIKIRQYAKRQMTWFKRNKDIEWVEPEKLGEVEEVVKKFLE